MLAATLIWLAIGAVAGTISARAGPEDSYGLRGDIIIGFAGALAGGMLWPMMNVFIGVGLINAVIGGVAGVCLALPTMRLIHPELVRFLNPAPKG